MRFEVITDEKVKGLMKKKEALAEKVKPLAAEIEKHSQSIESLEEDIKKIVLKIQRYNDKEEPLLLKYQDENTLGEFEEYSRAYFEGDELRLEIIDAVELFKTTMRDRKKEVDKKKKDGNKSTSENKDNNR